MAAETTEPKLQLPLDRPPIYVSAGPIKSEREILQYAGIGHLAAQVIGSFSEHENTPPGTGRIFYYDEENAAAYNAFRLKNPGRKAASKYLPECIKESQAAGQLAIVSITALKHENPLLVVPDLVEWALTMGADAVEINTSCPNENSDELLCRDIPKTKQTIALTRERVGEEPYLILKVSALGEATVRQYKEGLDVDAVSPINSERKLSPLDTGTQQRTIEVNDGYAGQSGPAITTLARRELRSWLRPPAIEPTDFPPQNPQFDVWSVGGIEDGHEGYHRVHDIGSLAFGGAQEFYRAAYPALVAERWARQYEEAAAA